MPDKAHRDTDKLIEELEKELSAVYSRAQNELTVKAGQYFSRFNELDKQRQKLVDAGKLTEEEFKKWRQNKMLTGEHWQRMVEESARLVSEANKMALQYINGRLPEVYATNYNFTAGAMEQSLGQAVSFELINTDAVKYILYNVDSNLLPKKILDPAKDIPWNMKLVNSEVMQGIIQGEAIPKIAKRLKNVGVRNNESAVRAARTIVTQTENKARFDCAKAAEEKGILTKKRWVATGDSRTRDAHMEAWNTYGTRETAISIDEPFIVGGEKMMFAGDPNGSPWNVYNCRCATPHFAAGFSSILPPDRRGKIKVSFMDGQAEHLTGNEQTSFHSEKVKATLGNDYGSFTGLVNKSEAKPLYDKYADGATYSQMRNGGFYQPALNKVNYSFETHEGLNKYSTFSHESGHMFDKNIGKLDKLKFGEIDAVNEACKIGSGANKMVKELPSASDEFLTAVRSDLAKLKVKLDSGTLVKELKETEAIKNATSGIQDALDGFFSTQKNGTLPWGHGDSYYNRLYNKKIKVFGKEKDLQEAYKNLGFDVSNQTKVKKITRQYEAASEIWANVTEAVTCGGAELDAFNKYMPETVKAFKEIIKLI